jgi:predicted double-glycine peptidase
MDYEAAIGTLEYEKLAESKVPLIIGITVKEYDHFVVYRGTDGYFVYLADPIRGNVRIPGWEFVEQWQKNLVLVVAKKWDVDPPETSPLSVRGDEIFLGRMNEQFIRKRLTERPQMLPNVFGP